MISAADKKTSTPGIPVNPGGFLEARGAFYMFLKMKQVTLKKKANETPTILFSDSCLSLCVRPVSHFRRNPIFP
jgi:hypothetical protein